MASASAAAAGPADAAFDAAFDDWDKVSPLEDINILGESIKRPIGNTLKQKISAIDILGYESDKQKKRIKDILDKGVGRSNITRRNILKQKISTQPIVILEKLINILANKDVSRIICKKIKLYNDTMTVMEPETDAHRPLTDNDVSEPTCKIIIGTLQKHRIAVAEKFKIGCNHMNGFIIDLEKEKIIVFEPKGCTPLPHIESLSADKIKELLSVDLTIKNYFNEFQLIQNNQLLECPQGAGIFKEDTDCQTYSLYGDLLYLLNRDNIPKDKTKAQAYINKLFSTDFMNTDKVNLLLFVILGIICGDGELRKTLQWPWEYCPAGKKGGHKKTKKGKKSKKSKRAKKGKKSKRAKKSKRSKKTKKMTRV